MPITISLCLITKNEEAHLRECLESAQPWVDEYIVVDTGSTDTTISIATQLGAKVTQVEWADDFSAARNASLEQATGDWVIWLDADEVIPAETGMKLRMLASYADKKVGGFLFTVLIPAPVKGNPPERIEHLKLFRNLPEFRFTGRVHEQVYPQIAEAGYTVVPTTHTIEHAHYDSTEAGQAKRDTYYANILQKEIEDRPDDAFAQFNLGMVASRLNDHDLVIKSLETYHALAPQRTTVSHKAFSVLLFSYQQQQKWEKIDQILAQATRLLPHNPEILYAAGRAYYEKGDYVASLEVFEELGEGSYVEYPAGFDPQNLHVWTPYYLGLLYSKKGDTNRAQEWLAIVAKIDPKLLDTIETIVNNEVTEL